MKKLIALVLCLALFLPALALAEAAATEPATYPVDFGDFTMTLKETDLYQQGVKQDGQVMAQIYPDYDENAMFTNNLGIGWLKDDYGVYLSQTDPAEFAQSLVDEAVAQFAGIGLICDNAQVHEAVYADDVMSITYSVDVDYTPMGIDLCVTLWQQQIYLCDTEWGTYFFTMTAASMEELDIMDYYLDSIVFDQ